MYKKSKTSDFTKWKYPPAFAKTSANVTCDFNKKFWEFWNGLQNIY